MEPEEAAWAAGLFEGEGCFIISSTNRRGRRFRYAAAAITLTDFDVLSRFLDVVGVGRINGPYLKKYLTVGGKPYKPHWRWQVQDRDGFRFFASAVKPWLGTRRLARLEVVLAGTSGTYRYPEPAQVCKQGHPLVGENRTPNGLGLAGRPKITCTICRWKTRLSNRKPRSDRIPVPEGMP
jgi:hypothetical protein